MKRVKVLALLLVGAVAIAAGLQWSPAVESVNGSQLGISSSSTAQQVDSPKRECTAAAGPGDATAQSCQNCPKKLDGCGRVSCDPCCYRCPGDPILRCF